MKEFLDRFQKVRIVYNKSDRDSGLVCVTGLFEGCPYVRLHRDLWICDPAEIFFSVWADKDSESAGRLHYNIHALKLRRFRSHVITSRNFAENFRNGFRAFKASWPNVRVDYGPLNLMQGWIDLHEKSFESDVLLLLTRFNELCPIIDRLLEERIAPVRRAR